MQAQLDQSLCKAVPHATGVYVLFFIFARCLGGHGWLLVLPFTLCPADDMPIVHVTRKVCQPMLSRGVMCPW